MNKNQYCVIMAGGIGTRFWPMSRTSHPKQFIDILGTGQTLLGQTYSRFVKIIRKENIYIVTNDQYKKLVINQIPDINEEQIVCEPSRRNTAPCIAYACYKIHCLNPDANIVVAPSDHIIMKEEVFLEIISSALKATAANNWLLTLGIKPSRPDTGYGYIQFNEAITYQKDKRIKKVKTFTEKPVLDMAKQFLKSGDFLWNSGIFIWTAKNIIEAFEKHEPEISSFFKEGLKKYNTPKEKAFIKDTYTVCRSISIDYAVMEKADNVYVLQSDFGWSDLGTWGSLYETRNKNKEGNAVVGKNVMIYDSKNCIVNMPNEKLVILQGLHDCIIVESDGILLICKMSDEQHIRKFVNDVKVEKGEQYV
ncbi:MAG: mannose-1-phosphate guanylyltransferase [Bacteroidota bacterium]